MGGGGVCRRIWLLLEGEEKDKISEYHYLLVFSYLF